MGRKTRKGTRGTAAQHLTRGSSLKKLQLSLADFRRLCILKGIYPRDPKKKAKGRDKTYYHANDILHLFHEPLLGKFRDLKAHDKKIKKALGRQEKSVAKSLVKRKPVYSLFHLVKQRYPTLLDCLRDLDDALSTVALFASLPADDEKSVTADVIADATRLFDEFLLFASHLRLLRKVFCSIKGFYFQIRYLGQLITFLVPHQFPQELPSDIDYRVMLTFLEFYRCVINSVNFKVYSMEELAYPPSVDQHMLKSGCRFLAMTTADIKPLVKDVTGDSSSIDANPSPNLSDIDKKLKNLKAKLENQHNTEEGEHEEEDEEETDDNNNDVATDDDDTTHQRNQLLETEKIVQNLFKGKTFFLSREVPRLPIAFMLKSCGADLVGWQGEYSQLNEDDQRITHHILDRPITDTLEPYRSTREFIQPQWIFDSINSSMCLPIGPYQSGIPPPPHLSPFVDDLKTGYIPQQRVVLESIRKELRNQTTPLEEEADESSSDEKEDVDINEIKESQFQKELAAEGAGEAMEAKEQVVTITSLKEGKRESEAIEKKERQKALLSKKHKRLLDRIEFGKQRRADNIGKLQAKRSQNVKKVH